jgi:hypothetical protein
MEREREREKKIDVLFAITKGILFFFPRRSSRLHYRLLYTVEGLLLSWMSVLERERERGQLQGAYRPTKPLNSGGKRHTHNAVYQFNWDPSQPLNNNNTSYRHRNRGIFVLQPFLDPSNPGWERKKKFQLVKAAGAAATTITQVQKFGQD